MSRAGSSRRSAALGPNDPRHRRGAQSEVMGEIHIGAGLAYDRDGKLTVDPAPALSNLADSSATRPSNGQVWTFNSTTGLWYPATPAAPGTGTVTSVSVTTANGFSGTVATATTTPAITIVAGAITPTTVNGVTISGSGTLAVSTFTITAAGNATISGTNTGDQTTVSGNAGTATALQTARTINGTSFDGTANITVTAAAGTLTGATLNATVVTSSLTSCGVGFTFPAGSGTAVSKPLLTSGTVLTVPEAGAIEFDGNCFYLTPNTSSKRGAVRVRHGIYLNGAYTLTSTVNQQKLFNSSTNGTLTLAAGTYRFKCLLVVTGMSATSGNAAFSIKGGGTATIGGVLYHGHGIDVTAVTGTGAQQGSFSTSEGSAASIVGAATGTAMGVEIEGTFRVTVGGTIIPSISLVTAAAAIVASESFFEVECVGDATVTTIGAWT